MALGIGQVRRCWQRNNVSAHSSSARRRAIRTFGSLSVPHRPTVLQDSPGDRCEHAAHRHAKL